MAIDRRAAAAILATLIAVPAEGIRQKIYYDPPGILTVCYGHTGPGIDKAKTYTMAECKTLLTKDMSDAVSIVDTCQPGLPTPVLAAFSDAVYNIGPKVACDTRSSTAARKLAARDYSGACDELPKWDKARVAGFMVSLPGLTKRRAAERDLCLKDLA